MKDTFHTALGLAGGLATVSIPWADINHAIAAVGMLVTVLTGLVGLINLSVSTWQKMRGKAEK